MFPGGSTKVGARNTQLVVPSESFEANEAGCKCSVVTRVFVKSGKFVSVCALKIIELLKYSVDSTIWGGIGLVVRMLDLGL